MSQSILEIESGTQATIETINDLLFRSIKAATLARRAVAADRMADAAEHAGRAVMLCRLAEIHSVRVVERRLCSTAARAEIARAT
jgi:hypothetical protein